MKPKPDDNASSIAESQLTPLALALEGLFGKNFKQLPASLRGSVKTAFGPLSWDTLHPEQRRRFAEQWDLYNDPTKEAERDRVAVANEWIDRFDEELRALPVEIAEWERVKPETVSEMAHKEERLRTLKARYRYLDDCHKRLRGDYPDANFVPRRPPRRPRSDRMDAEIKNALRLIDGVPTPTKVMQVLRTFAGKEGSCITESCPDGVIWLDTRHNPQKLSVRALGGRLLRLSERALG